VNAIDSRTQGMEVTSRGVVAGRLTLDGSYSWFRYTGTRSLAQPLGTPEHSANVGAWLKAGRAWEMGGRLYLVGTVPSESFTGAIESYQRLDLRLVRNLGNATLSVVGQNLIGPRRSESGGFMEMDSLVSRGVHATINWQF
jgi:hypothetical protein